MHVRFVLCHHVAVQIVQREDGAAICESFPYRILPFVTVTLRDFEGPHEGQILAPMGLDFFVRKTAFATIHSSRLVISRSSVASTLAHCKRIARNIVSKHLH